MALKRNVLVLPLLGIAFISGIWFALQRSQDPQFIGSGDQLYEQSEDLAAPVAGADYRSDDSVTLSEENRSGGPQNRIDPSKVVMTDTNSQPDEWISKTATNFYENADRISYAIVDATRLVERLRYSSAYMYAESGSAPPLVPDEGHVDLAFQLFPDRQYGLRVTDVAIKEVESSKHLIVKGDISFGGNGVFRFTSTDDGKLLSGYIETEQFFTRFDTWKLSDLTAIAEFSNATLELNRNPID